MRSASRRFTGGDCPFVLRKRSAIASAKSDQSLRVFQCCLDQTKLSRVELPQSSYELGWWERKCRLDGVGDDQDQSAIGLFEGDADDDHRADFRRQTAVSQPDLAPCWKIHFRRGSPSMTRSASSWIALRSSSVSVP